VATAARADDETYSYTLPPTDIGVIDNILLEAFNPSLGTLEDVTLTMGLSTSSQPTVINLDTTPDSYLNAYTGFTTILKGPDSTSLSLLTTSPGASGTANPGENLVTPAFVATPSGTVSVAAANFGQYESGSVLDFSVEAATQSSGGTKGNGANQLYFGGTNTFDGSISVDYTYAAVPEPAAWRYLPLIACAFCLVRWRAARS
jgi:hypothetical protein